MHECIEQRVRFLKQRHVNRRKKHVLKNRVHLDYLNKLHENYVLVPADKAANNVINPLRACAGRVMVVVQCVRLSATLIWGLGLVEV